MGITFTDKSTAPKTPKTRGDLNKSILNAVMNVAINVALLIPAIIAFRAFYPLSSGWTAFGLVYMIIGSAAILLGNFIRVTAKTARVYALYIMTLNGQII